MEFFFWRWTTISIHDGRVMPRMDKDSSKSLCRVSINALVYDFMSFAFARNIDSSVFY